jgi:hypothetical protein
LVPTVTGGVFTLNGVPQPAGDVTFTVLNPGTTTISYSLTTGAGCTLSSAIRSVLVNAGGLTVTVVASGGQRTIADTVIALEGDNVVFTATGNPASPIGTYSWTGGQTSTSSTISEVAGTDAKTFTVTYSIGGCTATRTVHLRINKQIFIPNYISPGSTTSDEKNRKLSIFGGYAISNSDFSFTVFNRYGNQVYSTSNFDDLDANLGNGWVPADELPTDVYNYVIKGKLKNGQELLIEGRNTGSVYVQKQK